MGDPHADRPGRPLCAHTKECPLEKWFRDAKIYELFEGTAEIQRLVISRMQAAEYRERLLEAAAIAAEATEPALGGSVAATSSYGPAGHRRDQISGHRGRAPDDHRERVGERGILCQPGGAPAS